MVKGRPFPPESPYLVAAIDFNHNGSVVLGRRLIELAASSGAHAVKFAIRRPLETLASELLDAPWLGAGALGRTQRDVWTRLQLRPAGHAALRRAARAAGVAFVAAPYDERTLASARALRPDAFQIDPPVLTDAALVRAVGRTGRPVLLVAGMCTERDIEHALRALGRAPVVVLHTVSAAHVTPDRTRLGFVRELRARFRRPVGYLGREAGTEWSLVAAAVGAVVIEKPFTLDRAIEGPHHAASVNPEELRKLAADLRQLEAALEARAPRQVLPDELDVLALDGCTLVARRRLTRGTRLRREHVTTQAPLRGLSPRLWEWIEGRRLAYDVEAGEPLTFGLIE